MTPLSNTWAGLYTSTIGTYLLGSEYHNYESYPFGYVSEFSKKLKLLLFFCFERQYIDVSKRKSKKNEL